MALGQTQPMFIGLVSLDKSQISLYSTLFVNHAVLSLHAKKVAIRFGSSNLAPFFRGQKWLPWQSEADDRATVWLGAPVLQWTLSDLREPRLGNTDIRESQTIYYGGAPRA